MRDPYKMDREGQFRLAPLPRERDTKTERKATIYSAQTIGDYRFNAMPVYDPKDAGLSLGPAPVWPIEFYAAMGIKITYERRQYEEMDFAGKPALTIEDGAIEYQEKTPHVPNPESNNVIPCKADKNELLEFIGQKNYNYIFENPV